MNDHRVHVRYIQPGLNDSRGDEHVDLLFHKLHHDIFKFPLPHLSVGKCHFCIGQEFLELTRDLRNVIDPVIYIVYLTASRHLPVDCFFYELLVVFHHISLDRSSVVGRFL